MKRTRGRKVEVNSDPDTTLLVHTRAHTHSKAALSYADPGTPLSFRPVAGSQSEKLSVCLHWQ